MSHHLQDADSPEDCAEATTEEEVYDSIGGYQAIYGGLCCVFELLKLFLLVRLHLRW